MKSATKKAFLILAVTAGCQAHAGPQPEQDVTANPESRRYQWVDVSGTGVHYFTTAIIHSVEPTPTGIIQTSTDIVELQGDLNGRLLYHPVSVFDFTVGTLVNTGDQVFSGTVLESEPVLLHDDEFRFDVNLFTGETVGLVFLENHIAGERIRCELNVFGTGLTEEGDAMVGYTGKCRMHAFDAPPKVDSAQN